MNLKQRRALEKAGEKIASEKEYLICCCLDNGIDLHQIPEAKMIRPDSVFWWGQKEMDLPADNIVCRNARLLGIAMMLTMPKEFVDNTL